MQLVVGLLTALLTLTVSCGGGETSSEPVSVVRMRQGDMVNGECVFGDGPSRYPASYSGVSEDCLQAVNISPLSLDELEQMKREETLFWEQSSPYQYALLGQWIDGDCEFDTPYVRAFLEFSEIASTDRTECMVIVDTGPFTEKQIQEVQRLGTVSESAVPAPSEPVPGQ